MRPEREFAINACKGLENELMKYGFKFNLKKLLFTRELNEDITQVIHFSITRYFSITADILVCSKKVKKWAKDNYKIKNQSVFGSHLGYLTPLQTWKSWEVGLSDIAKKQFHKEFLFQIETYIVPLLDEFNTIDLLIKKLIKNNGDWSNYKKGNGSILPIEFVLVYGNQHEAQLMLDNYLNKYKYYLKLIREYNTELNKCDFTTSEFVGATQIKIAIDNGLKINQIN